MTPALVPAQRGQRDGQRQSDPPAPRPPGHPSGGVAHRPPVPPPPPARLGRRRQAASGARGCPTTPTERVHLGGMCRRRKGDWAEGLRPPPPERGGGEPRRDPPPCPSPPRPARKPRGRRPHTPRKAKGMIAPPPPAGPRRPGGRPEQGPPPRPSRLLPREPRWTSEPAPTHKGATGTAAGDSKRARTVAVWGPRPPWPERRQGHPLCCLPREGRGTDRGKATPRPTAPPRPHSRGERRTGRPPPTPPPGAGTPQTRGPTPRGAHSPRPGRGETGPGRPPPPPRKPNGARDRGRTRGGARTAWNGPTSAQHRDRARCARHTNQGRGGGRGRRGSASAHTVKGHAGKTRRTTGPSPRNAQTAWSGVPASEDKGHPDGTARHTQRRKRGAGRGKRGRHDTWHRPKPPKPAASAAHTQPGHCTRQGSSGTPRHAPAPRLGSLRASPRGSHWRQASSTGPAAPAPRATTHQGGDVVGKRLQLRLLSDALTGSGEMGKPGRDRAPSPVNPGDSATRQEVCHKGPPTRSRWGGYHLARPGGPPGPKGV